MGGRDKSSALVDAFLNLHVIYHLSSSITRQGIISTKNEKLNEQMECIYLTNTKER